MTDRRTGGMFAGGARPDLPCRRRRVLPMRRTVLARNVKARTSRESIPLKWKPVRPAADKQNKKGRVPRLTIKQKEMRVKVLIVYGSKYGATAEIAEKIGEVIKQEGLQVDVKNARDIKDANDYQAFVIGSAAYIGGWRKEVSNFVKKNENTLAEHPVWVFSSGPTEKGDPVKLMEGWLVPKGLKPVIDRIKPRDITVFHGVINIDKLNALEKWMIKRVKTEIGDFRDWEAITRWAKGIADALKKEGA